MDEIDSLEQQLREATARVKSCLIDKWAAKNFDQAKNLAAATRQAAAAAEKLAQAAAAEADEDNIREVS